MFSLRWISNQKNAAVDDTFSTKCPSCLDLRKFQKIMFPIMAFKNADASHRKKKEKMNLKQTNPSLEFLRGKCRKIDHLLGRYVGKFTAVL